MNDILTQVEIDLIAAQEEIRRLKELVPGGRDPKPWSYWNNLRQERQKTQPGVHSYFTGDEQIAMEQDMIALGDRFMDGNYNSDKFKNMWERRDAQRDAKRSKEIIFNG